MMTSICSDTADAKPTTVDAVNVQGILTTSASNRLKTLVSLALLTLGISGLLLHARRPHSTCSKHGYWANATARDEIPTTVVPCSVDLPELLEAAGVTGIDAKMILREDHGCCGDDICALGEDSDSCVADCPEGTTGQLVWQKQSHGNDEHHHHHHHSRDNGGADIDHDGEHGHDEESTLTDPVDGTQPDRDHEESGKGHGKGHYHSCIGKAIASAVMFLSGLGLLLSVNRSLVAVARDFYTFLCPPCGHTARLTQPTTAQELSVNAITVAIPAREGSNAETSTV